MPWEGSNRRAQLPNNWPALREQRRKLANNQCEWIKANGQRCTTEGTECDHWVNRNDHRLESLRWLCHHHHNRKTQTEATAGHRPRPSRLRPEEPHPGTLGDASPSRRADIGSP